jgi:F-type H+-transporting ATPase subunit epsilon
MSTGSTEKSRESSPSADLPIRCQVVTPERIVVDEWVSQIIVPLPDGEFGIARNHDPVIARLGYGSFRFKSSGSQRSYFIDGGFLQIRDNVVVILTNRAVDVANLNAAQIDQEIASVKSRSARNDAEISARMTDLDKLRSRRRLAPSK